MGKREEVSDGVVVVIGVVVGGGVHLEGDQHANVEGFRVTSVVSGVVGECLLFDRNLHLLFGCFWLNGKLR